tara:strand:- start:1023 stop:1979 length:957 start_codon:yes stop_codon:yes gene_type:complete
MDLAVYKYLAISGGGLSGKLFLGSIRAIGDHLSSVGGDTYKTEWFEGLKGIVGCSAGAMVALAVLLNLSYEDSRDLCHMGGKRQFFMRRPDLEALTRCHGLDDASGLYDLVGNMLRRGGLAEDITFRDLRRYVPRDFVVVASNVETCEKLYISHETYPDMRVSVGIVASCSIPFVYAPVRVGPGMTLCDGGLCENQPVVFPVSETLNLAMCCPRSSGHTIPYNDIGDIIPFVTSIFGTITNHQARSFDPAHTLYCISPGTEHSIDAFSFTDEDESVVEDNLKRVRLFVSDQIQLNKRSRTLGDVVLVSVSQKVSCSGR